MKVLVTECRKAHCNSNPPTGGPREVVPEGSDEGVQHGFLGVGHGREVESKRLCASVRVGEWVSGVGDEAVNHYFWGPGMAEKSTLSSSPL